MTNENQNELINVIGLNEPITREELDRGLEENTIYMCSDCGDYATEENIFETDRGDLICETCRDNNYTYCYDCDRLVPNEDIYYIEDRDCYVCESCREDSYYYCENCESYYSDSAGHWNYDGSEWYCENCWEDREEDTIKGYHDRDLPLHFMKSTRDKENEKLFLGFELEVEYKGWNSNSNLNENAKYIRDNYKDLELCFEHDSSLDSGFEIISQPMTINYIYDNKEKIKSILEYLSSEKYVSHNSQHCGLHIHFSRKAFGDTEEEQNKNIGKLDLFFQTYQNEISKFARRESTHYAQYFDSGLSTDTKMKEKDRALKSIDMLQMIHKNKSTRYYVVNNTNSSTIEIRCFRGTLKYETFMATLEFVNNLVNVIKDNYVSRISFNSVFNYGGEYIKEYCKANGISNSIRLKDTTKDLVNMFRTEIDNYNNTKTRVKSVLTEIMEFSKNEIKQLLDKDLLSDDLNLTIIERNKSVMDYVFYTITKMNNRTRENEEVDMQYVFNQMFYGNMNYSNIKDNLGTLKRRLDNIFEIRYDLSCINDSVKYQELRNKLTELYNSIGQ